MSINEYFDRIYVLNLHRRSDRMQQIKKKLNRFGIVYDRFGATDGFVMDKIWESYAKENKVFTNPNYIACAISHLSIYKDAISNGYKRILIIEDDVLINRNVHTIFESLNIPNWEDILYLGYIPLSDDQSMWTYQIVSNYITNGIFLPKNLWGLYAYGITDKLMMEMLDVYKKEFPMEIDRYFVSKIQPRGLSIGISPQIFACQDIYSDNMNQNQINMLQRSVDIRFASLSDYE